MRCLVENNKTVDKPIPHHFSARSSIDSKIIYPKPVPTSTDNNVERIVTEDEVDDENFRCEPGKTFKIDCNRCWCARNGKEPKSCTRIACNPTVYPPLEGRK